MIEGYRRIIAEELMEPEAYADLLKLHHQVEKMKGLLDDLVEAGSHEMDTGIDSDRLQSALEAVEFLLDEIREGEGNDE